MPTLRAALIAWVSLVAAPALAQPVQPPPEPPPPTSPAGPAPAAPDPAVPDAAPAPPPPPPSDASLGTPETPPVPAPDAGAPVPLAPAAPDAEQGALPDRLSVGKSGGFLQLGALLQFWAFVDRYSDDETASTGRIRRAEVRVKGEIAPKLVGYNVMVDAAKTLSFGTADAPTIPSDTSILQDYFITFMSEYADVSVGQYKIPISLEGCTSSSKTIFPERSRSSRQFGDTREIGLRIEKKLFDEKFYYYAALLNGSGQNRLDEDNEKDAALRVEVYPVPGVTVAAVGYTTIGTRDELARDRAEVDLRYDANNVIAQAEYIHAWDSDDGTTIEGHGGYLAFGYTFIDRIQPIVRVGFVDEDLDTDENTLHHVEAGLNYLLRGTEMKLSLVGGHFRPQTGPKLTQALLAAQVSY